MFGCGVLLAASAVAPPTLPGKLLEELSAQYGPGARERLLAWQALVKRQGNAPELHRLRRINKFLNRTPFVEDRDHWLQEDYWATPAQFLASNGGDCEDYAVAKLFSLQGARIDPDKLRMMYVTATEIDAPHMVLLYRANPEDHPLVLDNLTDRVMAARDRTDLIPVYSFNASGLWLNSTLEHGVKVRDQPGSALWSELLARIEDEGVF